MKILRIIGLTALIVLAGCTPSDRFMDSAQKRIDVLKSKGVPDSSLSQAKVFIYDCRENKRLGKTSESWKSASALRHELANAEALYNDHIAKLQPSIDSLMSIIRISEQSLTGLQKKKLDSMKTVIDSFVRINWFLQAYARAQELTAALPQLKFDEDRARELRDRIPGTWVCINVIKGQGNKDISTTEKKVFTFNKDGTVKLDENKHGQSSAFLKEDWQFLSNGTYDFKGDTICLFINHFAAIRQDFNRLYIEGNKKNWKLEKGATYDSTITDGSQDRYITFTDLKEDFKQQ